MESTFRCHRCYEEVLCCNVRTAAGGGVFLRGKSRRGGGKRFRSVGVGRARAPRTRLNALCGRLPVMKCCPEKLLSGTHSNGRRNKHGLADGFDEAQEKKEKSNTVGSSSKTESTQRKDSSTG